MINTNLVTALLLMVSSHCAVGVEVGVEIGEEVNVQNASINELQLKGSMTKALANFEPGQWVVYQVNMEPGNGMPCCIDGKKRKYTKVNCAHGCSLDEQRNGWGSIYGDNLDSESLSVFFKWEGGQPKELIFVGSDCKIDAAGKDLINITGVGQKQSFKFLKRYLDRKETRAERRLADEVLMGIALHEGKYAHETLEHIAGTEGKLGREAIFWLGEARNEAGYQSLLPIVENDKLSIKARQEAIFALSENSYSAAMDKVAQLAASAEHEKLQITAMFWLAEKNHPKALETINGVLKSNVGRKVKDEAVFSISELEEPSATKGLLAILKGSFDKRVKKSALFWLGQSDSPEALAILEQILFTSNSGSESD